MIFEYPLFLFLLWIAPIGLLLLLYSHWRSKRRVQRFVHGKMIKRLVPEMNRFRMTLKGILFAGGIGLMIIAIAGPRFGVYFEDVESSGVDIFVLLDVSRSMLAEDITPNRLEHAKSDIMDFLEHAESDRVGLIAFAGKPIMKVPLTNDRGFFRQVLQGVGPDSAPRGGTAVGDAIRMAVRIMPKNSDRQQVILLISDGEDHDSMPQQAAEEAAGNGIRIFAVGIGDPVKGGRIPITDDAGKRTYLFYNGEEVWTRSNGDSLEEIAKATDGVFIPVGTKVFDFGRIREEYLDSLQSGTATTRKQRRYHQQYQGFLAAGIACLAIEMLIRTGKKNFRDV